MAGFYNDVMYANNVDFSGGADVAPKVTTDGQLLIGATAAPNIRVGTLTAGSGITVTPGAGSLTIASTATVPLTFHTDGADATPALNAITIAGGGSITTSGSGSTVTVSYTAPSFVGFHAALSAPTAGVTGEGTEYTVIFDNDSTGVNYDTGSNYNNATGVFTAPSNGIYVFTVALGCAGINNSNNEFSHVLWISDSMTSVAHTVATGNAALMRELTTGTNSIKTINTLTCKMTAGYTAYVTVAYYSNGAKNVNVVDSSNGHDVSFAGYLLTTT